MLLLPLHFIPDASENLLGQSKAKGTNLPQIKSDPGSSSEESHRPCWAGLWKMSLVKLKTHDCQEGRGRGRGFAWARKSKGLPRWPYGRGKRPGFDPWVGKIPWRKEWQSTPVFWPGQFHGQRSLAGCSPWGHKESDMTEQKKVQKPQREGKRVWRDWRDEVCQGSSKGDFKKQNKKEDMRWDAEKLRCCSMRSESESDSVVSHSLRPHSVHGILQARIVEWVSFPFSRGTSQPREWAQISHTAGRFFTNWAIGEAQHEKREVKK